MTLNDRKRRNDRPPTRSISAIAEHLVGIVSARLSMNKNNASKSSFIRRRHHLLPSSSPGWLPMNKIYAVAASLQ